MIERLDDASRERLQSALDDYHSARPLALDELLDASGPIIVCILKTKLRLPKYAPLLKHLQVDDIAQEVSAALTKYLGVPSQPGISRRKLPFDLASYVNRYLPVFAKRRLASLMEKQRNGWAKHVPLQVRPAARSDTSTAPNSVGPADPHTSHTKEVARREQREFLSKNLWEHVRSLPEIERRVVELRTREEKTFAQVAQGLGLKDGEQAQYHYWKALQRLRGKLREM